MPVCALRKLVFAIAMTGTVLGTAVPASMAVSAERLPKPQIISNVSDSNDQAAAFSSDGRYLLKGGARGGLSLWEMASGQLVRSFIAKSSDDRKYIYGAGYSPALDVVIANDRDFVISIWKASTGQLLRTIEGSPSDLNDHFVFAPDGKRMFYAQRHGDFIEAWDTARWKVLRTIKFAAGDIALSSNGRFAVVHSDTSSALIDVSSGRELWHSNAGSPGAIAFSPDGSRIAAAGTAAEVGTVVIVDVQTGRRLAAFNLKGTLNAIKSLAYSRDGAQIIAVGADGSIVILDGRTGQAARKTTVAWGDNPDAIALSPGGDWLVTKSGNGPQKIWDTQTGVAGPAFGLDIGATRLIRFLAGSGAQSRSTTIVTANFPGASGVMHRWDLATGHLLANQKLVNFNWDGSSVPVALSPDGRLLVTGTNFADDQQSEGSSIALWDASTGAAIGALGKKTPNRTAVAISPDGKWLLSSEAVDSGDSGTATLWNIAERKQLWSTTIEGGGGAAAFSRDMRYVLVGGLVAKLLDAANGALLMDFKQEEPYGITSFAFSPDGGRLVLGNGNWDTNAEIWDAGSGKLLHALIGHEKYVSSVAFSPDGSRVLTGGSDGTARIWDAATGRQIRLVRLDSGSPVSYVTFTPDGTRLISGHWDGAVAVWDAASGALIVTLIASADGEWVAITPDGFFDASANGARLLHVVNGVETVSIDQVFQNLFRPDLVREKLAGDPRGLVRAAAASLDLNRVIASGSAPQVRVTVTGRVLGTATNAISAEAEMIDRGGGIGRIEWRVNGVTRGVDNPAQPAPGQPLRLARTLSLGAGNNVITVVAYNRANLIASVPSPAAAPTTTPTGGAKPRLFALVAGVNAYADPRLQLEYAVADATEVARGLRQAGGNLYQSVDVKVMTDADVTREKLDAAFKDIAASAQPSDVFVLYLAGHGKTVNGRYYFAPQDLRIDGELTEKNVDPAVVAGGISQDQLQQWFAAVPADRSLILLDTCESGTFAGDLAETKRLEHGGASDRISRATGRSIIAATSSSEEAFEAKTRGHGLFTYEMLDAFANADSDGNGTVELTELAAFVYARVSDQSEKEFRQRQTPQIRITANYALVETTRVLGDAVGPVAEAKPTYQLAQTAQLQVQPGLGATVVRSLSAHTPVTVLENSNGWALLASGGKPIGYVATQDLQPVR